MMDRLSCQQVVEARKSVVLVVLGALLLACERPKNPQLGTTQDQPAPTHNPDSQDNGPAGSVHYADAAGPTGIPETVATNEGSVDSSAFISDPGNAPFDFCECLGVNPGVTVFTADVDGTLAGVDASVPGDAGLASSQGLLLHVVHPDFVGPDCGDQLLRGYGSRHCGSRIGVQVCSGAEAQPPCIGFTSGRVEYIDANGLVYRGQVSDGAIAFDAVMPAGAIAGSFVVTVASGATTLALGGTFEFCGHMDPTRPPC